MNTLLVMNICQKCTKIRDYAIYMCIVSVLIIGFSQLSDMEFFVDPKNEMSETEIHPLCGWE